MASRAAGQFSYQRLTPDCEDLLEVSEFPWRSASRSWTRSSRRFQFGRRSRLRIPSLGRFFKRRSRLLSAFTVSCRKVLKRLVEGRSHFGELFAGNYMFMQVTAGTSSMRYCLDKQFMAQQYSKYLPSKVTAGTSSMRYCLDKQFMAQPYSKYLPSKVTAGTSSMRYCLDKQFMAQQYSKYLPSKVAA